MSYNQYPVFRVLLPLVAGILLYRIFHPAWQWTTYLVLLMPLAGLYIFGERLFKKNIKADRLQQLLMSICWVLTGYMLSAKNDSIYSLPNTEHVSAYLFKVEQEPVSKTSTFKTLATITHILQDSNWIPLDMGVVIYSPLKDGKLWHYDDVVAVKGNLSVPLAANNPYQFDYKKYLQKKGVYYQSYIKKDDVISIQKDESFTLRDVTEACKAYTQNVFYSVIPDSSLAALSTALLIGYQEEIDADTKNSFSRVGAMHILAVSGLHVGIIFMLLSRMLFFMDKNTSMRVLKAIILIVFLWSYAFIAGFSASIVRASMMFTLMIPMLSFKVQGNIYNNLCSSAALLLLWNPDYLFDVGFQLSYLAVLGIIYLYPGIYKLIQSKYWLFDQIWQLTAVSIAAQILTTPVILYNFGQFPLSFLVSNLLAVPVSTLIVYVGILTLALYKIPFIATVLGKVLYLMLLFMTGSIEWTESIPYAFRDFLMIDGFQALLLYVIIFSFSLYMAKRSVGYIKTVLVCCVLFNLSLIRREFMIRRHKEVIIYSMNRDYCIEYINGHQYMYPERREPALQDYKRIIHPYHVKMGIHDKKIELKELVMGASYFEIKGYRFFILRQKIPESDIKMETDFLLLSDIKYLDVKLLRNNWQFQQIILLNNHSRSKQQKLEEILREEGLPFHSISSEGCWRLDVSD